MKTYSRILSAVHSTVWAIQPEKLQAILAFLELKAAGQGPSEETLAQIQAANIEAAKRASSVANASGSVAVIPVYGLISHRTSMMSEISGPGGTSCQQISKQVQAAANDPGVKAIVLDIDSPGGTVDGVAELADEIYQARGKKQITAVSDCLMASAAYWIAAACNEIAVSPSSQTGSIGVYGAHEDYSGALEQEGVKVTLISAGKYKTEGNPYEPLNDDARAAMQQTVDDYYGMFVKAVAKGRGVKADDVRNGFGEGRVVGASQAVKLGMADRVATLDQVLSKLGVNRNGNTSQMAAEQIVPIPLSQEDQEYLTHMENQRRRLALASL